MLKDKKGLTLVGLVVVLIVILAIGFGIYKIFFATKSLKIKDLEDMYIVTTRSPAEAAWDIVACDHFEIDENNYFGLVVDNSNEYRDGHSAERPTIVRLVISQDWSGLEEEKVAIQAGDRVELTYDGGQRLLVYLPRVTHDEDLTLQFDAVYEFTLYVAPDGSTYYDKKLTQLAQSAP